jgi:hypothetical protein
MDALISQRLLERLIHQTMLIDQSLALESRGNDNQLPVVASARVTGIALLRVSFISSGEIIGKILPIKAEACNREADRSLLSA